MLAGNPAYELPGDYESIATVTLSTTTATVTFSSIPSTYSHLQIRGIARDNDANALGSNNITLQFNSDTGNNYAFHYLYGDGSSAQAGNGTSQPIMLAGKLTNTNAITSNFSTTVIDILDYGNTNKYKTIRVLSGFDNNGSGLMFYESGLWQSTSAVTSLDIKCGGASFVANSHFALYGIKGAA